MCWPFRPAPGLDPGDTTETSSPPTRSAAAAPAFAGTGLVGGDVWTRPGLITTHHRDRPLSERESRRWPETAEQAKEVLAPAAMVTRSDGTLVRDAASVNVGDEIEARLAHGKLKARVTGKG